MPSPSRSFARLASCLFGIFVVLSLLFVAGCSSSNSQTPPPPTAPTLSAAVAGLGSVSPGQTGASYTITVSNAAGSAATSGTVTVTDPPTNFTVTAISGTGWTCTLATLTCTRSDALAAGQSYPPITVTGTVTGAAGQSISIPITISGGGQTSNVTSSPSIAIVSPPSMSKAFNPASIGLNANSSLTFTITNPAANTVPETGLAFSDTLPSGMVVATPNGLANTCSGTATATAGSGSVSLSGGTVAAAGTCTVTVNVTGTTVGVLNNTSGAVSSTNGGTGNTASATLTVVGFPTISKAFGASSILLNASTFLTFTITNPVANTAPLTGVAFSDALTGGLVVASPNGLTNTCGGTPTATAGSSSVSMTGGTVAVNATCTLSVNVTGTTAGTKTNTTGVISSTQSGAGATSNTVTLGVIAPPSISKAFGVPGVAVNGTTSLTFTITNPAGNTVALNGVAFTDSLPAGTVVATPNALVNNCSGTATATAGSGSVSLSGASVAAGGTCTVVVNVTATAPGNFTNTTGAVTSTNGGTGGTATANLSAAAAPTISKAFGASTIPLNGTTSLTFTITSPAGNPALTGVAFSDTLTAGLVVASPNGLTNTCGGTVAATAGSSLVSLTGGNVAASGTCTIAVNATGSTAGAKPNTTGAISSTQSGTGAVSNTATLTVTAPPTISKNFGAATVPVNTSTSLTFTVTNPNTANSLSGIAFTDTLPAGMSVSTPNGLTGSCGGGMITATAGTSSMSLSGATLAAAGNCNFSVNVTPTVAGANLNTTGHVTSTEGGTGGTASATLSAIGPPSISKAFGATGVTVNGTTSLTFTITNPNTVALAGVAFTDAMPTGLVVASTPGVTNSCSGTVTAAAGSGNISLAGGSVAANASCTVVVSVTATQAGSFPNTTGAVSSTNGGTGATSNTATLNAAAPPTISKAFGASSIVVNNSTSLTFTITNPAANAVALTGVAFTDTLPAGLVVTTPNGLSTTCGGTAAAVAGSTSVSLASATVATNSSCTLAVNVTGTTAGAKPNTTGAISSTQSGAGAVSNTATLAVIGPPTISKAFGASAIVLNGSTPLTFTINNPNTSSLSGVAFTDTLMGGLQVSSTPNVNNSCGSGTVTAGATSTSITFSGGTLAASGSCTISLSITGTGAGTINNTTSAITSTEGGTGATSNTASLTVFATPTITILSSNSGPVGSSITITGTNFGSTQAQGSSTVTVNGVTATPTAWGPTSITTTVPTGATGTGNVIVTVLGVPTATSSNTAFTVTNSNGQISGQIFLSNTCGSVTLPTFTVTINTTPAQQVQTDTNGNYSFASVPNGTYTITPSITGAASSLFYPVSYTGVVVNGSSVSGKTFNAVVAYNVSGNVSYSGSQTGQTYLYLQSNNCGGGNGGPGTSITQATLGSGGAYTIHGVQPGNYTLYAWMDSTGVTSGTGYPGPQGQPNANDPTGSNLSVSVTNANVTGAGVTMISPTYSTPNANPSLQVFPNAGGVTIFYNPPTVNNANGNKEEDANEYLVEWALNTGTDSDGPTCGTGSGQFASVAGSHTFYAVGAHGATVWILNNTVAGSGTFVSGNKYCFQAQARNTLASTISPSGWGTYTDSLGNPAAVTIPTGAPTCTGTCTTVSGTVTIPAGVTIAAGAPLYVGLFQQSPSSHGPSAIYATEITSPVSGGVGNSYSIAIPSGSNYTLFGILDQNKDGQIDAGDVTDTNNNGNNSTLTVSGSTMTGVDTTLPGTNSTATVQTQYSSCGTNCSNYNLSLQVREANKLPVSVTLYSGPNLLNPVDMGQCSSCGSVQFQYSASLPGGTPNVNDTYNFTVTYSDGSVDQGSAGTINGKVTAFGSTGAVVGPSDAPTNLLPNMTTGPTAGTRTQPTFTWTDSSSATGSNFFYSFSIYQSSGCTGNCNIWQIPGQNSNSNGFPSSINSLTWGTDPTGGGSTPSVSSLTTLTPYSWQIQVQDSNGNQAQASVNYTP